jgi:acyl dehydratase
VPGDPVRALHAHHCAVRHTLGFGGLRWKFKAPVKIGDAIRLRAKVVDKKDLDKPDRGQITLDRTILNQRDEVVQQGQTDLVVQKRP